MKMDLRIFLISAIVLLSFGQGSVGEGNMCGTKDPDPAKTCVTVRLPWQAEPMHFCVEKEKFRYRNKCMGAKHCWNPGTMRNDTLVVTNPWDCCPLVSLPTHCNSHTCPQPPINRKCVTIDDKDWGDCCPKYFCEEGVSPESCEGKRLDPMCSSPPQGKMNCVAFYDPYGCCQKYQCDGEGKPGLCPMQSQAMQLQMRYNASHTHWMQMNMTSMGMSGPPTSRSGSMMNWGSFSSPANCIGDTTCPGAQKCCSFDITSYGDGRWIMKNVHPTHGHCTDPVMMAPIPGNS